MTLEQDIHEAIIREALRLEEDTEHSFKGHYNAAFFWSCIHHTLGIPTAVLAAWAGVDAFSATPDLAGYLALATATLAAIQTILNPADKSAKHKSSGGEYQSLRNKTRRFREIDLASIPQEDARGQISCLAEQRDELNRMSLAIPRWAYWQAKKDIDGGLAHYRVDTKKVERI